jgi:hypothetical protein
MAAGQQLATAAANKLLKELGISAYLRDDPCRRTSNLYSPAVNGWNKGSLYLLYRLIIYNIGNHSFDNILKLLFHFRK